MPDRRTRQTDLLGASLLTAVLAVLCFPAVSQAGCGGKRSTHATAHSGGQAAPLALGDSTLLPCPPSPTSPALTVRATGTQTGFVGASIAGPPGTQIQLGEQLAGQTRPLQVVQLPASGTATVSQALRWLCYPRDRQLVVATLPPAAPSRATSAIRTPSCSQRLVVDVGRRASVGGTFPIRIRDRWATGDITFTICVAPPGSVRQCEPWSLRLGQSRRVIRVPAPRPGGWQTTVKMRYGVRKQTLIWVLPRTPRIRLLAAGDSEMQILDDLMAQDLARYRVQVTNDARISTGLTNPFFFDWPAHARHQAPALHPDVTILFMGANDGFSVTGAGHLVGCCSTAWRAGYASLVAQMMRTYLRGDAGRVYWFLLPAPRPTNFHRVFDAVNAGIRAAAARFPGRVSLIDANSFFTPGDRYRDYMVYRHSGFVIHEADGIHLSTASDSIAAQLVTERLLADRVIR